MSVYGQRIWYLLSHLVPEDSEDGFPDVIRLQREIVESDKSGDEKTHQIVNLGLLLVLYMWRLGKGVYRLHPEMQDALSKMDIKDPLDMKSLLNLPDWCPYIHLPTPVHIHTKSHDTTCHGGFVLHVNNPMLIDNNQIFIMLDLSLNDKEYKLFNTSFMLEDNTSIYDMVRNSFYRAEKQTDDLYGPGEKRERVSLQETGAYQLMSAVNLLLQAALYIGSVNSDVQRPDQSRNHVLPKARRIKGKTRWFAAKKVDEWQVGWRIGSLLTSYDKQIREYDQQPSQGRARPRPHIRKAHWHVYWQGKRNGKQQQKLRWLQPMLINGNTAEDVVTTIRDVEKVEHD